MLRGILIEKGLSNRELDVAVLVSKALTNREIGERLYISEKTVKFHVTSIFKKMNVKSRAQLIVWCVPHLNFSEDQTKPVGNDKSDSMIRQEVGSSDESTNENLNIPTGKGSGTDTSNSGSNISSFGL